MTGITFDTGALIALEQRRQRITKIFLSALQRGISMTVPVPVLIEWWRGRSDRREAILEEVDIELTTISLTRRAGEAIAHMKSATAIDALVMASASTRGDVVFTRDVDDLERLRTVFPEVRILSV
ncbi:type II toxin-antitoxin system VapC family toxin [Pendulispora albinea]